MGAATNDVAEEDHLVDFVGDKHLHQAVRGGVDIHFIQPHCHVIEALSIARIIHCTGRAHIAVVNMQHTVTVHVQAKWIKLKPLRAFYGASVIVQLRRAPKKKLSESK